MREHGKDTAATATTSGRRAAILKILAAVAVLALLLAGGRALAASLDAFTTWVQGLGAWGPVAFIAGYVAACVAFVPGAILTLAAGAIFGLGRGVLYVFIGAVLGSSAAFLVARHLARRAIKKRVAGNPKFAAIDQAIAREGLKIVLLLRLSPVFPFNLLNYGLGLTRVSFRDYLFGSIGMIPGTVLYVYYGAALGSLAQIASGARPQGGPAGAAVLVVGLLATIAVTVVITRAARRALQRATGGTA
jgi:uncharacterized membrane protein YdjX (TVP38/TMEM64 family)